MFDINNFWFYVDFLNIVTFCFILLLVVIFLYKKYFYYVCKSKNNKCLSNAEEYILPDGGII